MYRDIMVPGYTKRIADKDHAPPPPQGGFDLTVNLLIPSM